MSVNLKRKTAAIIEAASAYAQARADAEALRRTEGYPYTQWRLAWNTAHAALSALMAASLALEDRPTSPTQGAE